MSTMYVCAQDGIVQIRGVPIAGAQSRGSQPSLQWARSVLYSSSSDEGRDGQYLKRDRSSRVPKTAAMGEDRFVFAFFEKGNSFGDFSH